MTTKLKLMAGGLLALALAGWLYASNRKEALAAEANAEKEWIAAICEAQAWREIGLKYAKADADIEIPSARWAIAAAERAMRTARDARDLAIATEELHDAKAELAEAEEKYRKAEEQDEAIGERVRKAGEARMAAREAAGRE